MIKLLLNSNNKNSSLDVRNNKPESKVAILCSGGSLNKLNLLNEKIDYVILINYFWFDGSNNSNIPLWKTIYEFLKGKKIILLTRDLNGITNEMFQNLNIIKIFKSQWSTSLLKKYKWLNNCEHLKKKLRLTEKKKFIIANNKVANILPDFLFNYCKEDLINWNKGYNEFERTNFTDINLKNWWLSTFGHSIDIAIKLLNSKNIYIFGWDNYEGGSLNDQKIAIKTDIIYKGIECRKQWVEGNKAVFINKVLNNADIKFNLYTYSKYNNVPQHYEKNLKYDINTIPNLNIFSFNKT